MRPTEPRKRTSAAINPSFTTKVTLPGECPGVWTARTGIPSIPTSSPSSIAVRDGRRPEPGQPERRGLLGPALVEGAVPFVEPDRRVRGLVEALRHDDVIGVAVREEDPFHASPRRRISARTASLSIEGSMTMRLRPTLRCEEVEIVLEGADREPLERARSGLAGGDRRDSEHRESDHVHVLESRLFKSE